MPVFCYVARLSRMAFRMSVHVKQMEWAFAFVPGGTFLISRTLVQSAPQNMSSILLKLIESILLGYIAFAVLQTTRPTIAGPVKSEFVQSTADVVL